jgi:CTP-dependent riboflavin kinase
MTITSYICGVIENMAQLAFNNNHNHTTNVTCYRHDVQLKHSSIGVQPKSQSHYKCGVIVIVVERQLSHVLTVHHDDNKLHL